MNSGIYPRAPPNPEPSQPEFVEHMQRADALLSQRASASSLKPTQKVETVYAVDLDPAPVRIKIDPARYGIQRGSRNARNEREYVLEKKVPGGSASSLTGRLLRGYAALRFESPQAYTEAAERTLRSVPGPDLA